MRFRARLASFSLSLALAFISITAAGQTPATSRYRIAGTVVSRTDNHPLARARVVIANVKDTQQTFSTVSSDDGKFEFTGVPAGKFSLSGAKRAYLPASYNQHEYFSTAIVTGASLDTENLILRLWPAAYVVGKVLDESGDPVRRATVILYRSFRYEGASRIEQARSATTNDLGEYELGPQVAGTYFVSVQAMPWYAIHPTKQEQGANAPPPAQVDPALDVAYPATFYPDVTDTASATPIELHGGDRVEADIHLNPVPALHLFFQVATPSQPNRIVWTPMLMQSAFGDQFPVPGASSQPVSSGLWEMTGVPAGRYNVRMSGADGGSELRQVDLVNDGDEVDTSSGAVFSNVKLQVNMVDESSLPGQVFIGLRLPGGRMQVVQKLSAQGEAQLQQVPSGRYEIFAWEPPGKQLHVAQITSPDANVSGHLLNVSSGTNISAAVSLFSRTLSVQGIVKKDGRAIAGAMVLLVPKDPATHPDLFRRDQSDLDGTFQINEVVPGSYNILAIDDGWDLDWLQPAVLAPYIKSAQEVEVGGRRPLVLSQPIEAQAK